MDNKKTALVTLDQKAGNLQGQLYRALRERILGGTLRAGTRLPSTRQLAISLGLSRNTVVGAYEQLQAEGYIRSSAGKPTQVADVVQLPVPLRQAIQSRAMPRAMLPPCLQPGVPDLSSFPAALWGRLQATQTRRLGLAELGYEVPYGLPALREAILAHISVTRGVMATPEQVLLFPSTRAAVTLISRVILRHHARGPATAWVEDPTYPTARWILRNIGAELVPIPVDNYGIDIDAASVLPTPNLIYTTPSHQYPTGSTISLARRLGLLEFARANNAFILEDDYDSEFQFNGRPITALQGIDRADCVAYIGTLSKVMAPGLHLAYAVVPHRLLDDVRQTAFLEGSAVSIHTQAAFLAFIQDGHFGAHIRRMTQHYATRMAAFHTAIAKTCATFLDPGPGTGGLQLALWFKDQRIDDKSVAQALQERGYAPDPLSEMYLGTSKPGLLCGIANLPPEQASIAAHDIAAVLTAASTR